MSFSRFGHLWASTVERYERIRGGREIDHDSFSKLLTAGGFSQTLILSDARLLKSLLDWQIIQLADNGHDIDLSSSIFAESHVMPKHQLFRRDGRLVSVDFLRVYSYLRMIEDTLPSLTQPKLILEIGTGYGALARLLKLRWSDATVCMIDLGPSLNISEYYIRESFPAAKVVRAIRPKQIQADADFVLIDASEAGMLERHTFDLAVNTWSFGEMPNSEIVGWFNFIQNAHDVRHMFCLNHFLVTTELTQGAFDQANRAYDWIDRFDAAWHVTSCAIDPYIQRAPMLRSQHLGLAISARRLDSETDIQTQREAAAGEVQAVYSQQWMAASVSGLVKGSEDAGSARRKLLDAPPDVTNSTHFDLDQITRSLNVWRPDFEASTFFLLWNDIRLNRTPLSIRAMRIWLHLQWKPQIRIDGTLVDTIFREEISYSKIMSGKPETDPLLRLPAWMAPYFTEPGRVGHNR